MCKESCGQGEEQGQHADREGEWQEAESQEGEGQESEGQEGESQEAEGQEVKAEGPETQQAEGYSDVQTLNSATMGDNNA